MDLFFVYSLVHTKIRSQINFLEQMCVILNNTGTRAPNHPKDTRENRDYVKIEAPITIFLRNNIAIKIYKTIIVNFQVNRKVEISSLFWRVNDMIQYFLGSWL